jgi:hypothetical protein
MAMYLDVVSRPGAVAPGRADNRRVADAQANFKPQQTQPWNFAANTP